MTKGQRKPDPRRAPHVPAGQRYRLVLTVGEGEDALEVYSERDICDSDQLADLALAELYRRLAGHIERWDPATRTYERID